MDHSGPPEVNVEQMRHPYKDKRQAFTEDQLVAREPFGQFRDWFNQACATPAILEPNAMCLSTATADGRPSARFVLLKGFGHDGFRFFTNYESRKAAELDSNPRAALTFYWEALNRSVRVEGSVSRLPEDVSEQYFHSRPISSQIGAALCRQSVVIPGRQMLEQREEELARRHADGSPVPRPNWGGYIVRPHTVEFWQGQSNRVHDRIRFRRVDENGESAENGESEENGSSSEDGSYVHKGEDGWVYERLAP
ncbi:pyridoxine-5'-phosphate oxidase-like [Amphibalanus amphitrite]|uniref:pyridoxine-5'-phosphate oxidase-like n=1 Tax=Amphibalanus amphitrite TaxID=1232801 RepID=UPI001C90E3C9|nr:pyridoxine-5'-phosphate oxidase-like [Amphibalanus amphitrite]XP_043219282.1 pyridoxine-5'-phosphate oxidase-like [Amphibalanus amphitrite]XP_043219283.1 pyridoxine-5'-phosphate oxidase-like [Amphibalanus amphitrite]XP_043222806.1 pyridoxine-5'-phosphate oxidase-like [Amphibalanus amphitrite]